MSGQNARGLRGHLTKIWRWCCCVQDRRATTAVEFALIAPAFVWIFMGIIETSLYYSRAIILEGGVRDAARLIRTGAIKNEADPLQVFKDTLCDSLFGIIKCEDIVFRIQTVDQFSLIGSVPLFDDEGKPLAAEFTAGASESPIIIRVGFRWTFLTPVVGTLISPDGSGTAEIISTAVFRNEPYEKAIGP